MVRSIKANSGWSSIGKVAVNLISFHMFLKVVPKQIMNVR